MSLVIAVNNVNYTVPSSAADENWAAQVIAFWQALATGVSSPGTTIGLASISQEGLIGTAGDIDPQALSGRKELTAGIQGVYFSPGTVTPYVPVAGTTIPKLPTTNTIDISLAGDVAMTATPTLDTSGVDDGAEVLLINRGAHDFTVSDDGTIADSALRLSAATCVLTNGSSLRLRFFSDSGLWYQVGNTITV